MVICIKNNNIHYTEFQMFQLPTNQIIFLNYEKITKFVIFGFDIYNFVKNWNL